MTMVAMAVRSMLATNRLRLLLTLACVALGVALAGAVHTIHASALAEIERAARTLAGSADVEIHGARMGFDERVFVDVARRPEVLVASPVLEIDAPIARSTFRLRVLGLDPMRAARLQPALVADAPTAGDAASVLDLRQAWLSPSAARHFRLRTGDTLRHIAGTQEIEWRVAGVLPHLESAGDVAVVDIAAAQASFGRVGTITRIDLRLRPGVDTEAFRRELAAVLPAGVVASPPAAIADRLADISRAYRMNLDALALVALATGAFLVFSTLALHAARRRQEFALLRALGVTRRGVAMVLAAEGAIIGAIGSLIGTLLGLLASRALLERLGPDLGAGYFGGEGVFAPDLAPLAGIAALGTAMCVGAALWIGRTLGRIDVAAALRDRAIDLPVSAQASGKMAILLGLAGLPLLAVPPMGEIPIGGYAAIGAWLGASVLAVAPFCRWALRWITPDESPIAALAFSQVRHLPGHLAASVAGIVVSASLCVAMAIMVYSFRVSFEQWLGGVVGADLYLRSAAGAESGYFTPEEQDIVAALPEVSSAEPLVYDRLAIAGEATPLSILARPVNPRVLAGFSADPPGMPPPSSDIPVWISEAARDLHGWKAGDRITLPFASGPVGARVAGVIRDYARTWGAVIIPIEHYRRLTGDLRANDLAIHLAAGVDAERGESAIRAALPHALGVKFQDAVEVRRRSLRLFDRSFAVTYALEAAAIAIGLAGITSSFAALAWSRRREFGVLRFLGLRRRDVLRLLAAEGAATGALGTLIGVVSGIAISLVLVHVVNRQSFHWTVEVHWPLAGLAVLIVAIVALCAFGARASAALAVRKEAILAVKDDA